MSKAGERVWLVEMLLSKEAVQNYLLVHKQLMYKDTEMKDLMVKNKYKKTHD